MEEYIEAEVERRMLEEVEAALGELELRLPRERFIEVAEILAGVHLHEHGRGGGSAG
jgi:hypothetical protein